MRAALRRASCASTRLRALYFDTADRRLAGAGFTLRLRREGRQWVQALKGGRDSLLSRQEHEVARGAGAAVPVPDLACHAGTREHAALLAALDGDGSVDLAPAPAFEIQVLRIHRRVRHEGATIELAFDEGWIRSGPAKAPVCELELELKSGCAGALIGLARRWALRHGLWIDARTKAQRGWQLAQAGAAMPAARGTPPALNEALTPDAALRACVAAALRQVLANGAELAADAGGAEHVHQARVGLRRLLSVLREFGAWSADVDAEWSVGTSALFRSLGQARDRDALAGWIVPQLQAAGAPPLAWEDAMPSPNPAEVFRSAEATQLMFDLLAFAHDAAAAPAEAAASVAAQATPALLGLHRRLRRAGKSFTALDEASRHRARKQLKRLRYCAESLSSLWPSGAWAAYALRLKNAQDALGRVQDAAVAKAAFTALCDRDPRAWFALGWLAARESELRSDAGRALRALGRAPKFMR